MPHRRQPLIQQHLLGSPTTCWSNGKRLHYKIFQNVSLQILQIQEGSSYCRVLLLKILMYIPTTLPTLLFCRIAELTIALEGNTPSSFALWEEMVQERTQLEDIFNDVKMIGKIFFPIVVCGEVPNKHRKNCECCPGHYLIVDHYSSI